MAGLGWPRRPSPPSGRRCSPAPSYAQGLTVEQVRAMPFYQPVVEEGIRIALGDLAAKIKHDAPIKCRVSECGVGGGVGG